MRAHKIPLSKRRDAVLIRIFQRGYDPAFNILVKRHHPELKSLLHKKLRDPDLEKDVEQNTLLQAVQRLRSHRCAEKEHFSQWLFTLAYYNAISAIRKKKNFDHPADFDTLEQPLIYEHNYFQKAQAEQMKKALNILNKHARTIVILRVEKELAFKAIADRMTCSVSSVTSAYSKAIKKLRKFYEKEE